MKVLRVSDYYSKLQLKMLSSIRDIINFLTQSCGAIGFCKIFGDGTNQKEMILKFEL